VPASVRHGRGQYFTPDRLVDLVLQLAGSPESAHPIVLDPACGSGRFLLAARDRWSLPATSLRGFETDVRALSLATGHLPGACLFDSDFLEASALGDVDLLVGNPPYVRDRGAKRDLYVDFLEAAGGHLRVGGRLALVLSNAWLDVGYGRLVRRLLRDQFAVEWVVESAVERWFEGAKVNTMILVARRCDSAEERDAQSVRFGLLKDRLPALPELVREVPQRDLGVQHPWGPLLRAPDLFLDVQGRAKALGLVPLGELVTLRRGFTTNDNRFFYPPAEAQIESEYLWPLLKSPKRIGGVHGRADALADRVFLCSRSREELLALGHPRALSWIDQHRAGQPQPSWTLSSRTPSRLFLVKGYADRFRQPLFDCPVHADQQLYSVQSRDCGVDETLLAALFNSSWFHLSLEMAGRVNFGDGVLWLSVADAREQILVPDLRVVGAVPAAELRQAFLELPDGRVPSARGVQTDPNWGPATRRLDGAVAGLLGLSEQDGLALRAEWITRCDQRLAMSVQRRGRRADPSSKRTT